MVGNWHYKETPRLTENPLSSETRPMRQLPLTLDTPAENLALDEALLEAAETGEITAPLLRLWESPTHCVVLGRSSDAQIEVHLDACQQAHIPILRRSSGGGTILAGPGCLMYSLLLDFFTHPQLRAIDLAHQFVLGQLAQMLSSDNTPVSMAGISDLVIASDSTAPQKKFSGNALRLKKNHLLYHGTLLYDFDLDRIDRFLATPTRTPAYRDKRQHTQFVTNLNSTRKKLTQTLLEGWQADQPLPTWPEQRTLDLVKKKYTNDPKWVISMPTK